MQAYNHFDTIVDVNPTANNTAPDAGELSMGKAAWYSDTSTPPGTTKKSIETNGSTANLARILPGLVDYLLDHGYKEEDLYMILGGIVMRVFDDVWDGQDVEITDTPTFAMVWRSGRIYTRTRYFLRWSEVGYKET